MDCSMPGFLVLHHLPEFAQTHVHWVGDGHPIISSSVVTFSSCLQSFPVSGLFLMSQLFASGQITGASDSASASVLPMNIQDWFPLGLTDLISWQSKGLSRVFSNTKVHHIHFYGWVIFHHIYIPHLLYSFICWWALRLFLCLGYCK